MGKQYAAIDARLRAFIEAQHIFFVATAPAGDGGHINLSPKGLDSLRILDGNTVAYVDYVGSGVETIAHIRQNQRIVLMFCAFSGPPQIVRLHGEGEVLEPGAASFSSLLAQFDPGAGVRSIIRVHVRRISDSCGYSVPLYQYKGERRQLTDWAEKKGAEALQAYQVEKNSRSIDGLPGLSLDRFSSNIDR